VWIERLFGATATCEQTLEQTIDTLDQHLAISVAGRSRVINIGYKSRLPQTAQTVANTLTKLYLEDKRAEKSGARGAAVKWLRSEIERRGDNLKAAEVAVEDYRNSRGLARGEVAQISSEQLSNLGKLLSAAQAKQAFAKARLEQLAESGNSPQGVDASDSALQSHTVSELRVKQAVVQADIARMATTYDPGGQFLEKLKREAAALALALKRETARISANILQEYQNSSAEVDSLSRQLEVVKRDVANAGDAEASSASMIRNVEVQREVYVELAKKADQLETEQRLIDGDAELVNYAEFPEKVWFPKATIFAAMGAVLALAGGAMAAILYDLNDHTVRSAGGLEEACGIPVLTQIPDAKGMSGKNPAGLLAGPASPLQEAIRSLYASWLLIPAREASRVMLVTSSGPAEGKTFVTLSLASFAAKAGKRVLVIEGDLRRPSFVRILSLRASSGLVELIAGRVSFQQVVRRDGSDTFDVIPSGDPVIGSTEILGTSAMQDLLEKVRQSYDLVLVDSPPSSILMDARVLVPYVDKVIYCALWGRSNTASVVAGIRGIQAAGGQVSGIVIDRVNMRQHRLYEGARRILPRAYLTDGSRLQTT
jgi:capsular exopolysaccharide synthesis family protein